MYNSVPRIIFTLFYNIYTLALYTHIRIHVCVCACARVCASVFVYECVCQGVCVCERFSVWVHVCFYVLRQKHREGLSIKSGDPQSNCFHIFLSLLHFCILPSSFHYYFSWNNTTSHSQRTNLSWTNFFTTLKWQSGWVVSTSDEISSVATS